MLQELLEKFRNGTCTQDELQHLKIYFESKEQSEIKGLLTEDWLEDKVPILPPPSNRMWKNIEKDIDSYTRVFNLPRMYQFGRAAAAILLIIFGGMYWFSNSFKWGVKDSFAIINNEVEPLEISLSDGTIVTLNQNSKLSYEENFNRKERQIEIEGEAFFEVAKDSMRPFIVNSGPINTKVLGTIFNVKAYPKDVVFEVALLEGKVEIEFPNPSKGRNKILLYPQEQLSFLQIDSSFKKITFEADRPFAWKKKIIYFDHSEVQEVVQILAKQYKVSFKILEPEKIKNDLVYKLDTKKYKLEEVLNHISLVTDYEFERVSKRKILVKPKED